jgi:D-alanyl-lipoteichoic acid acyltransferase DltB (MBOAT superfamily)
MLFDSPAYFVFLIPVVLAYWRLSHRGQNVFLLLASYFFYAWWDWRFLALMIGRTTVDFLIAQRIAPSRLRPNRREWLIFSLVLNFAILGVFRYFDFFANSFTSALNVLNVPNASDPLIRIILPLGISFYVFQEVAYIVDVYKGRVEPARSFLDYSLFISLFPYLIAGPIQRPAELLPQVQSKRNLDANRFFDGLLLIFSGLLRKCVVADNCALLANAAFNGHLGGPNPWIVLIGAYAFAWQVYGVFSGYSDIARGSAQLLGFQSIVNFRQPFLSQRLQEFWRRWQIGLSTWLRDYLYIPLGGKARSEWKTRGNLLATMLAGGLWCGASWKFAAFGTMQGVILSVERFLFPAKSKSSDAIPSLGSGSFFSVWGHRILTFNLFCLTLVFFRAPSITSAVQFLGGLSNFAWRSQYLSAFLLLCVFAVPLFFVDLLLEARNHEYPFAEAPYAVRTGLAAIALLVLAFFSGGKLNAFVYLQF